MITGNLDSVLIKAITNTGLDMVFVVRNLPKRLIYTEVPSTDTIYDRDGYTDGTQRVNPSKPLKEVLLEGLSHSQTHDKAILFETGREPGKLALEAIDQYISGTLPRDVVIPKRVPYALAPGDPRSNPKPLDMIPIVDLPMSEDVKPVLSSADVIAKLQAENETLRAGVAVSPAAEATDAPVVSVKPVRTLTPEQKARKVASLAKARAAKAAKKAAAELETN